MAKDKAVITTILLILVSFLLTACFKTNKKPIAAVTASPTVGQAPLEVSFDASDSFDPDGNIISYEWFFGDGSTGSGLTIIHTYNSEGTHQTKLTITDDKGGKDSATVEISIAKVVPYDDLMRHNEDYVGDIIYFRGKIIQVVEQLLGDYVWRVATEEVPFIGYMDDIIWVNYTGPRYLEDDIIDVYGRVKGLKTYTSIFDVQVTIPKVKALRVELIEKAD